MRTTALLVVALLAGCMMDGAAPREAPGVAAARAAARRRSADEARARRARVEELERAWAEIEAEWPAPVSQVVLVGEPGQVTTRTRSGPRDPTRAAQLEDSARASERIGPAWRQERGGRWVKKPREQREAELAAAEARAERERLDLERREARAKLAEEKRSAEAIAESRRKDEARRAEAARREEAAWRELERRREAWGDAEVLVGRVRAGDAIATKADERIRDGARVATYRWLEQRLYVVRYQPDRARAEGVTEPGAAEIQDAYDRTLVELRARWMKRKRLDEDAARAMEGVR